MTCGTKKGLETPRRKLAAAWQGDGTLLLAPRYHGLLIYLGLNGSQVLKIKFMCLCVFNVYRFDVMALILRGIGVSEISSL